MEVENEVKSASKELDDASERMHTKFSEVQKTFPLLTELLKEAE